MKNTEKTIRVSQWRGPGIVKTISPWRRLERPVQDDMEVNKDQERVTFKKWNLPDQPEGYIKSKKHDFL